MGKFTIFNIKGNKYRLIVSIDYEAQLIYYKYFLTHAEYDRDNWKNDDYYVSEVVNGKRTISREQAKNLGKFFACSPGLFNLKTLTQSRVQCNQQ